MSLWEKQIQIYQSFNVLFSTNKENNSKTPIYDKDLKIISNMVCFRYLSDFNVLCFFLNGVLRRVVNFLVLHAWVLM